MHIRLTQIVLAALTALSVTGTAAAQSWSNAVPIDSNATYETRNLLARLHWMRGQKMLFGHHETTRFMVNSKPPGEPRWSDVREMTGEWPGLFSKQINFAVKWNDGDGMREDIQFAYSIGAAITVCWHADNPVTGGNSGDTNIDFPSILPGGSNHYLLVAALSNVASYLETITNSAGYPIPLIYRAWHENNLLNSYWWNKATPEEFKEFWHFTVEYYRDTRGLHNLLYAFCPNWRNPMSQGNVAANYLETYPGDDYVDIMGLDYYGNINRANVTTVLVTMVQLANQHGKVPVLAECGAALGGLDNPAAEPGWYTNSWLSVLKNDPLLRTMPYGQTWYNKPAPGDHWVPYATNHPHYAAFMAFYDDPWTAFSADLEDLHLYEPVPEPFGAAVLACAVAAVIRVRRALL